jgi:signal transduction histidine kinase
VSVTAAPTSGLDDLKDVIQAYNDLAERLQESQRLLQREVARLREELAEKNRQIARKNRLEILGEMAAGVAHEIRNPLGGIELYAGLIAREASGNERVERYAQKIIGATRGLGRSVGEILDFTRPLKPIMRRTQLARAVEAALELAAAPLERSRVLTEAGVAEDAWVMGDGNLLQRAFLNVALNAADAMPDGGTLTVTARPAALGAAPAWQVSFADTGGGIRPEDLAKVFDPFFTRKEEGTGLGLAMTSRIVAAHEGRLAAANAPGGGAVFAFTLPAAGRDGEGERWLE